jgi:hypothetical protein
MGLLPYGQPTAEDAKEFYCLALSIFEDIYRLVSREASSLHSHPIKNELS